MKADLPSQRPRSVIIKRGSVSVKIYRGKTRGYDTHTLAYYEGGKRVRRTFNTLAEAKKSKRRSSLPASTRLTPSPCNSPGPTANSIFWPPPNSSPWEFRYIWRSRSSSPPGTF